MTSVRRLVVTALEVGGAMLLINFVGALTIHTFGIDITPPPPAIAAWAESESWRAKYIDEYNRAFPYNYVPYVGWRRKDFKGEILNIKDGIRDSYQPPVREGGARRLKVAFFGPSQIWGLGARDMHTVPSELARVAETQGIDLEVSNFGELGYTLWQQGTLVAILAAKGLKPDLLISYGSPGEVVVRLEEGLAEWPGQFSASEMNKYVQTKRDAMPHVLALITAARQLSAIHVLRMQYYSAQPTFGNLPLKAPAAEYADNAARWYNSSVEYIEATAASKGIPAINFFPPSIFTKKVLHPGEEQLLKESPNHGGFKEAYLAMIPKLDARVVRLTEALDGLGGEAVMYDLVHVNEVGNRAIAEMMFKHLEPKLRELQAKPLAAAN